MIKHFNKLAKRAAKRVSQGKVQKMSLKHEGCLLMLVEPDGEANPNWMFHIKNGVVRCSIGRGDSLTGNHNHWFSSYNKVVIVDSHYKG